MNFNFYILGTPSERYNQYPNDYTASLMSDWQAHLKGARLVICRKMNLIYYNYGQIIDKKRFIGFCVVFNGVHIARPKQLIALFKDIIENDLIKSGEILRYSKEGILHYNVTSFDECISEYESIKTLINAELETNESSLELQPLGHFGQDTPATININATDFEIVALTKLSNFVIVNDEDGSNGGYIDKLISDLRTQNIAATEKINLLQSEISKINRVKKQYFWIAILSIIVLISLVVLYFLNYNLSNVIANQRATISKDEKIISTLQDSINTNKKDLEYKIQHIDHLNLSISQYKDSIRTYVDEISNLNSELSKSRASLNATTAKLQALEEKVRNSSIVKAQSNIPLNITDIEIGNTDYNGNIINNYGSTIYSGNTLYLQPKIYYNGINAGATITLKIKWYDPSGTLSTGTSSSNGFSQQQALYVLDGANTYILQGWGSNNKGNWGKGIYRIEIWYGDMCLKSKTFNIY